MASGSMSSLAPIYELHSLTPASIARIIAILKEEQATVLEESRRDAYPPSVQHTPSSSSSNLMLPEPSPPPPPGKFRLTVSVPTEQAAEILAGMFQHLTPTSSHLSTPTKRRKLGEEEESSRKDKKRQRLVRDLFLAAENDDASTVQELLEAGADWSATDPSGRLPIQRAKLAKVWKVFAKFMPAPKLTLHEEAQFGDAINVRLKIGRGDDESRIRPRFLEDHAHVKYSAMAIHAAAMNGHAEVVDCLASCDINLDCPLTSEDLEAELAGFTPLHLAARFGRAETADALCKRGASLTAKCSSPKAPGATPLHLAARFDHPDVVRVLLEAGAPVNAVDEKDLTPLHVAANNPASTGRAADLLLILGDENVKVDAVAEAYDGMAPLHLAAISAAVKVAEVLIAHGANVDVKDRVGRTPLIWAAQTNNEMMVICLLKNGANPEIAYPVEWKKGKDPIMVRPIDVARDGGFTSILELLAAEMREKAGMLLTLPSTS
ncbi:Neurogenic locus notch protein 3 [Phlyctochytrium bullatum]|nr:Neurogenic locus notch protein 3 [Phlyctochytrium bullatum]